jgi:hypothetical protein
LLGVSSTTFEAVAVAVATSAAENNERKNMVGVCVKETWLAQRLANARGIFIDLSRHSFLLCSKFHRDIHRSNERWREAQNLLNPDEISAD